MNDRLKTFDKVLYRLTPMEPWRAGFYCDCDPDRHYVIGVGKDDCPCEILRYEDYSYLVGTTVTPATDTVSKPEMPDTDNPYRFGDFVDILYGGEWLHCVYLSRQKDGSHRVATEDSLYTDVFDDEIRRTVPHPTNEGKYRPACTYKPGDIIEMLFPKDFCMVESVRKKLLYVRELTGGRHLVRRKDSEKTFVVHDDEIFPDSGDPDIEFE